MIIRIIHLEIFQEKEGEKKAASKPKFNPRSRSNKDDQNNNNS